MKKLVLMLICITALGLLIGCNNDSGRGSSDIEIETISGEDVAGMLSGEWEVTTEIFTRAMLDAGFEQDDTVPVTRTWQSSAADDATIVLSQYSTNEGALSTLESRQQSFAYLENYHNGRTIAYVSGMVHIARLNSPYTLQIVGAFENYSFFATAQAIEGASDGVQESLQRQMFHLLNELGYTAGMTQPPEDPMQEFYDIVSSSELFAGATDDIGTSNSVGFTKNDITVLLTEEHTVTPTITAESRIEDLRYADSHEIIAEEPYLHEWAIIRDYYEVNVFYQSLWFNFWAPTDQRDDVDAVVASLGF